MHESLRGDHDRSTHLAEGEHVMIPRLVAIGLCGTVAAVGCATKSFVREQVTSAETKLAEKVSATEADLDKRAETQQTKLRETADRTNENREAIDVAAEKLKDLDARVDEVNAVATGARAQADQVAAEAEQVAARAEQAAAATANAEARLTQRLAGRNKHRVVDTKAIYFDSGRVDIRKQDVTTLDEVARALAADPNAILELQGFADPQGSDRYNRDLARERMEVVMRYLVQQHSIELRQLHGIAMGKVPVAAGEKATPETMAEARRVDLRVLTPWSSWEERTELDHTSVATPSATMEAPTEAPAALPLEVHQSEASEANRLESPARRRAPAFLRTLTPQDLGGE
jgi:outer membrane protein OmpA-like peptidoglycan-associated protein